MLLTVAEIRKHLSDFPTGASNDDVLTRLLAAAEAAINEAAGAVGSVTEFSGGGGYYLILSRPAATFTSVTETFDGTPLVLATNDYRASPSGYVLSRLTSGTNGRATWQGLVRVVYTPVADTAVREAVQVQLVQQFLNYNPGLTAESVGDWSQSFASGDGAGWLSERDAILATLSPTAGMVVIG